MAIMRTTQGSRVLREVIDRYQRHGYEVLVEPVPSDLPPFLQEFRPDLIAYAPNDRDAIVIEFAAGVGARKDDYLRRLAERISAEPGWQLEVVNVPPEETSFDTDVASTTDLADQLKEARELIAQKRQRAGFLLLWSSIEGALRGIAAKRKLRSGRVGALELAKALVTEGELTEADYAKFRDAFELRSRWAHGLRSPATGSEPIVNDGLAVAETLIRKLGVTDTYRHG